MYILLIEAIFSVLNFLSTSSYSAYELLDIKWIFEYLHWITVIMGSFSDVMSNDISIHKIL